MDVRAFLYKGHSLLRYLKRISVKYLCFNCNLVTSLRVLIFFCIEQFYMEEYFFLGLSLCVNEILSCKD